MRSFLLSSVYSRALFAPADIGTGTPVKGDNSEKFGIPAILKDLTAQDQPTVWDSTDLVNRIKSMRPELEGIQSTNESLTGRLTVLAAEFARHKRIGYFMPPRTDPETQQTLPPEEVKGTIAKAEDIREFIRGALGMSEDKMNGNKFSKLTYKASTVNQILTVAAKAASLVATGQFGYTVGYVLKAPGKHPVVVPPKADGTCPEGAQPRIVARWNAIEPAFDMGKGPKPNEDASFIPVSASDINRSYAIGILEKAADAYGQLVKGADEATTPDVDETGELLGNAYEALAKLTGSAEGFTDLETLKDRINAMLDLCSNIYDALHEDDPHAFYHQKAAAAAAHKAGGTKVGNGNGQRKTA